MKHALSRYQRMAMGDTTDRQHGGPLQPLKYHLCPRCGRLATLMVDVDTERTPEPDRRGRLQYYCTNCHRIFSIDRHDYKA